MVLICSVAGYFILSEVFRTGPGITLKRTFEAEGLRIEFQRAYIFEQWSKTLWGEERLSRSGLLIELKVKNIGDWTETIDPIDDFYIRDAQGKVYKDLSGFTEWDYRDGQRILGFPIYFFLELVPGESSDLNLFLKAATHWREYDFPKNMAGLKLVYNPYGEELATIALKIEKTPVISKPD